MAEEKPGLGACRVRSVTAELPSRRREHREEPPLLPGDYGKTRSTIWMGGPQKSPETASSLFSQENAPRSGRIRGDWEKSMCGIEHSTCLKPKLAEVFPATEKSINYTSCRQSFIPWLNACITNTWILSSLPPRMLAPPKADSPVLTRFCQLLGEVSALQIIWQKSRWAES